MIDTLAILAPGLLGGSVAQAARSRSLAHRIVIWARRPEVRVALARQPWCDEVADSPEAAVAHADLVVIATPVTRIAELTARVAPHLPTHSIVTDVGSVKADVCRDATAALAKAEAHFVGSHPMAGGDKTGWEHGSPDLFQNRTCFVTPTPSTTTDAIDRVVKFWDALGARVVSATPDEHDEIVAHISHLPQMLATTLGDLLGEKPAKWSQHAGNGLRDTTRIAGSDPTMWLDIFEQNRDEVLRAVRAYQNELHRIESALANRDWPELRSRLERGKKWRNGLSG